MKSRSEWLLEREALLDALREFAQVMKRRPFQNHEGLRGVSAFALYWFVRRIAPQVVFEVGVWKGFSTWLIQQAAPQAEVHCFDPLFFLDAYVNRKKIGDTYRSPRARYWTQDFSCAPIRELAGGRADALAFFDDHQNKLPRLLQCREAGVGHIVFDDNTTVEYTHRTLEQDRLAGNAVLEREIETYETFPALWPVDFRYGVMHIEEAGLGFPLAKEFRDIYEERDWHSYLTYVRLKSGQ